MDHSHHHDSHRDNPVSDWTDRHLYIRTGRRPCRTECQTEVLCANHRGMYLSELLPAFQRFLWTDGDPQYPDGDRNLPDRVLYRIYHQRLQPYRRHRWTERKLSFHRFGGISLLLLRTRHVFLYEPHRRDDGCADTLLILQYLWKSREQPQDFHGRFR